MKKRFYRSATNPGGSGEAVSLITGNNGGMGTASLPTTQSVAMNSQAEMLAQQFQTSTYMAMSTCAGNSAVKTVALETRFLNNVENANPQFTIQNQAAGNKTVIIGSALAMQGAYAFYGQAASACDSASMADQYGANLRALQGFSLLCNYTPVVIVNVQVISASGVQVAQPLHYADLSYDSQVNSITINVTRTFTRYDTNTGIMNAAALWTVGPQTFLSFLSLNSVDLTLTLTLGSTSSVRTFRQVN